MRLIKLFRRGFLRWFSIWLFCIVALSVFGGFAFALPADDPPPVEVTASDPPPVENDAPADYLLGLGAVTISLYDAPARAPEPAAVPYGYRVANEALDEVNALRARRRLRPFIRDAALTLAAEQCAALRAASQLFGHLPSDYAYLPPGATAGSTGCAAYAGNQWMTCCTNENWTYAGAAWAPGADGKRYMHLFVSNSPNGYGFPEPLPVQGQPAPVVNDAFPIAPHQIPPSVLPLGGFVDLGGSGVTCSSAACSTQLVTPVLMAAPQAQLSASGVIVRQTSLTTFAAPQSAPAIRTPVRTIGRAVLERLREGGPLRRLIRGARAGALAGGCG